jgi:hypothetical protein
MNLALEIVSIFHFVFSQFDNMVKLPCSFVFWSNIFLGITVSLNHIFAYYFKQCLPENFLSHLNCEYLLLLWNKYTYIWGKYSYKVTLKVPIKICLFSMKLIHLKVFATIWIFEFLVWQYFEFHCYWFWVWVKKK